MIYFPISRENRNLEPLTIRYDVGDPVSQKKIYLCNAEDLILEPSYYMLCSSFLKSHPLWVTLYIIIYHILGQQ